MANEFKHKTVGTQLTQTEYEAIGGHVLDSQAAGDIIYASSTTQLSRLGIGTAGKLLAVNSGATAPEYVAAVTGVTSVLNAALVIGRDADNDIDFGTDNTILFRADGADQIKLTNGALLPVTDDDIDLGSSSLQFKDGYFDGTLEADAITVGGTAVLTGGAETAITSVLNASLVVGRDADNDIDFGTDNNIIFRAGAADQIKLIDGALAPVTDNDVDLGTSSLEFKDAFFDGTVTTDALAMATNTADMLLIADGSTFNPTAISSLSEISSVEDNDVFIAIDTSGGGLKKIARSAIVSGLATSSAISNVVDDSTPQLGGNLDVQTNSIITDTGNRNIKLKVHGTGKVEIQGNTDSSGTNPGTIILNCEQNSHGQTIKAQAHSASVTNTLTLPAGGDGELLSTVATQTLTNKTLTSPKINEDVAVTSTATEINILDGVTATTAELNIMDGVTSTTAELNILDGVTSTAAELNILDGVTSTTAELNILDGVTATATELNIMDGNTSVGTTAVADGDGIVTNDGGTMKQTSVETFATYFGNEITSMSNLTSVGTLTTLTVDNIITNGTTIGHTDDTDLMTLADGSLTLAGTLNANDDINLAKQKVIKIGGTQEAHDFGDEHSGHGITVTMEAGELLTEGAAVYVDSNGKAQHPDVDAAGVTGKPAIGIAMSNASSGTSVNVLVLGLFHDDTYDFTPGSPIIMTGTDGALTTDATATAADGDIVQRIGIAITADTAFIMPSIDEIEHA